MGTKQWQLTLTTFDRWLVPVVALWFWYLLDPVSATAHSQVLYVHIFGLWLGRWCRRRCNEVGGWMESTGFKTGVDEIHLRGGTFYCATLGKQIEARGYMLAYWTISCSFDLTLCLILGAGWLALQFSWLCAWWNVLGSALYNDDLAPHFWSTVSYFAGPWLIVICNYFAHRLSTSADFQDSVNHWYHTAFGSSSLAIAPDTLSLKCIRLSLNRMVLFYLLLAKCAVWTLPRALVASLWRSRTTDSAHWLVEALALLQETTNDLESSWQVWPCWKKLYQPFNHSDEDTPMAHS